MVVTVYTAGAASALIAGTAGSLSTLGSVGGTMALGAAALAGGGAAATAAGVGVGALIAGAIVGGAVGSMASQGLAIAFDMQEDFDWKQVAIGGLAAGVSAGIGAAASAISEAATAVSNTTTVAQAAKTASWVKTAANWAVAGARTAVSNAATQGIAYATELQDDFNWRTVAASAVGAAVGAAAADLTQGALKVLPGAADNFWKELTSGTVSGFASGVTVAAVQGGRIDYLQIATNAFGSTLANSMVAAVSKPGVQAAEAKIAAMKAAAAEAAGKAGPGAASTPDLKLRPGNDQSGANSAAVDAEVGESAGAERKVTPKAGDSISSILGTSDPQAIGNFMAANNMTSSTIRTDREYVIPPDVYSEGDQSTLGQSALNRDNARLAAQAAAAAEQQAARQAAAAATGDNSIPFNLQGSDAPAGGAAGLIGVGAPAGKQPVVEAESLFGAEFWNSRNTTDGGGNLVDKNGNPVKKFEFQAPKVKAGGEVELWSENLFDPLEKKLIPGNSDFLVFRAGVGTTGSVDWMNGSGVTAKADVSGVATFQWAQGKGDIGIGEVSAKLVTTASAGINGEVAFTPEKVAVQVGFNAEAVLYKATATFEADKIDFGLASLSLKASVSGNAVGVGVKGTVDFGYSDGKLTFDSGMAATALFGAGASVKIVVDAKPLIKAGVSYATTGVSYAQSYVRSLFVPAPVPASPGAAYVGPAGR